MNQLRPELTNTQPLDRANADLEFDIRHYWNIVWREKWGIIGLVAVVSVMTLVIAYNMTPIYSTTATLLIEAKEANVVSIEEVYGIDSTQAEYFATQFEILSSRHLAEEVIRDLKLDKHPKFDPRPIYIRPGG